MAKSINLNEIKKALSFADEIKEFNTVKGEFVKSLKDGFSEIKKSADSSKKSIQENAQAMNDCKRAMTEGTTSNENSKSGESNANVGKKSILGGLGMGSMMTAAVASLMATPDLKEPMANLKASLEGVFTSIAGGGEGEEGTGITDIISNGIGLLTQMLQAIMPIAESVGGVLQNVFIIISDGINSFSESLAVVTEHLNNNRDQLMLLAILLGILATGIGAYIIMQNLAGIATVISTGILTAFSTAVSIAGAVMGFLTSTIGLVTMGIMVLVGIGYVLIKNWDTIYATGINIWNGLVNTIKNAGASIMNSMKSFFGPILDPIISGLNRAKEKFNEVFNFISGLFNKVLKPNIKMPRIEVTGKFSLNPLQVPKFGIGWYQTGGIFTGPSVIGVGENGDEAVLPLSNKRRMKPFANAIASMIGVDNLKQPSYKGVTINIDSMSVRDDMDIKKIAEELNRLTVRENRKLGLV